MIFAENYIRLWGSDKYIRTEVFNIYFLFVNKLRYFGCVLLSCKQCSTVRIAICSIDAIADGFDRFELFCLFFFVLRLTICQVVNFFLPFHSCLSFFFLVFKLIVGFGIKA